MARKFASIDHISKGRAGWNLVTSGQAADAYNFSRDEHYEHGMRYERAREFAQVVVGLWDSWDDDAFIRDKDERHLSRSRPRCIRLDHKGDWFSVRGPLNVPRTPQGRPVIVQAGGSEDMIRVAAEFAEVIFCAPLTIEQGRTFYAELKARMAHAWPLARRDEDHAGPERRGRAHARRRRDEKQQYLDELTHPIVAREILSTDPRRHRSVRLSDGRPDAAARADQDFEPEHLHSRHGYRPARQSHVAADRPGGRRRARQVRGAGHARSISPT